MLIFFLIYKFIIEFVKFIYNFINLMMDLYIFCMKINKKKYVR
jgi:hypothetical protein